MTEHAWMTSTDPRSMLEDLRGFASDRKLRLFACACCRSIWQHIPDDCRGFVEIAEMFADGKVDRRMLAQHRDEAFICMCESVSSSGSMPWCVTLDFAIPVYFPGFHRAATALDGAIVTADLAVAAVKEEYFVFHPFPAGADFNSFKPQIEAEAARERNQQAFFLRCMFGNRFRSTRFDSNWLTSHVMDVATTIYEKRAFDQMLVLGDALVNAGCDSDEIINHCRSDGPHVRGCWVIDLILSKEI